MVALARRTLQNMPERLSRWPMTVRASGLEDAGANKTTNETELGVAHQQSFCWVSSKPRAFVSLARCSRAW